MLSFPIPHPQVSDVLISDETQTEGPAGPLICSLHKNAVRLVKARAEAILELLGALIGEEVWLYAGMEEMLSKEVGGESNLREYAWPKFIHREG